MATIAVMGAGSWGTAYASLCVAAGTDAVLWARRTAVAEEIAASHCNSGYLADRTLPRELAATDDAEEALAGAEVVVLAVPSHALRAELANWRDLVPSTAILVSLVKGIELETRRRASEIIAEVTGLADEQVVVVSGPNLARECADHQPSATVAAGAEPAVARVQALTHSPAFRVYTNADRVGVELGGAVKNPLAIAVGIAHGMGFGDNTKAMLITRGLAEMTRLGVAYGGDPLTFSGLAGMGDLVATCGSRQSRNRHVGEQLGRGRSIEEVVGEMSMVAEGVRSSRALAELARDVDVEMPIVEHVVKVVHEGLAPEEMASSLMGRSPKREFHGLASASVAPAGKPS